MPLTDIFSSEMESVTEPDSGAEAESVFVFESIVNDATTEPVELRVSTLWVNDIDEVAVREMDSDGRLFVSVIDADLRASVSVLVDDSETVSVVETVPLRDKDDDQDVL